MRNYRISPCASILLGVLGILCLSSVAAWAVKPTTILPETEVSCGEYTAIPPFLVTSVIPSTTIILDNSGSMYEHAYQEREVAWEYNGTAPDERRAYAGYNGTERYYGYFDPETSYAYHDDGTNGYFYADTNGTWYGNLLNWVSMHRMDIARKVLTGGKSSNSTGDWILEVEKTDGGDDHRGKYHVLDNTVATEDLSGSTSFPAPVQAKIGFAQWATSSSSDPPFFELYDCVALDNEGAGRGSGEKWTIEDSESHFHGRFYLRLKVDTQPYGILDSFGHRMRFALFAYDDDGSPYQGGEVLKYMNSDLQDLSTAISSINEISPSTYTPLAESFYSVCGYIRQDGSNDDGNGPRYESDCYTLDNSAHDYPDPFYFDDIDELVECTQQNVILITDGEPTMDLQIPGTLKDYDGDGHETDGSRVYDSSGSDYLDDVALWAHTNDMRSDLDGVQNVNLFTISLFGGGSDLLRDAAINGGFFDQDDDGVPDFVDANGNGVFDTGDTSAEFDRDNNGIPDNYFEAESGEDLEAALVESLGAIMNTSASGSAASIISSSRKGQGALFQSIFWPTLSDDQGTEISWVGDTHAFLVDEEGNMYIDDGATPKALDSSDSKVIVFYDESLERSRACLDAEVVNGTCQGTVKDFDEIKYLWSAAEWLYNPSMAPTENRSFYNISNFDNNRRYIFTWVDDDDDGIVDSGETIPFTAAAVNVSYCPDDVVNWVRGLDQNGTRSRNIRVRDGDGNYQSVTWRMGDVVHSTPSAVSTPRENYDVIWGDSSYTAFYKKYKNRRVMVYFGGNDGMLHAISSGFYSASDQKYYRNYADGNFTDSGGPELGAEMWAYVPYNILPHLECLTQEGYEHQYFVDQRPRTFDVRIFNADDDHPNGWGTILVGGMRFGGAGTPIPYDEDGDGDVDRYFGSSYFVLDVTNPEKEPVLLGEITFDEDSLWMGYTVSVPSVVPVKDSSGVIHWYLVMGTGPDNYDGTASDNVRVAVMPLNEIIDSSSNIPSSSFSWRIPDCSNCVDADSSGYISISSQAGAVGTDFVAVDYDFDFFADILYFGTAEKADRKNAAWEGSLFQLKVEGEPDPGKWEKKEKIKVDRPITGAPNIGFAGENVWIYFGTGMFWSLGDKTSIESERLYGIIEPKQTTGSAYNFSTITSSQLVDVTDIEVRADSGALACSGDTDCLPNDVSTFDQLVSHIMDNPNVDGWYRELTGSGERVIGQPTLLGGLLSAATYTPPVGDICTAEGESSLYALYYLTGTAWKVSPFGDQDQAALYVEYKRSLGKGMSITPSLHVGSEEGTKAFLQTSTGAIVEVHQPNLPIQNVHSGSGGWHTHDID